MGQLPLFTFHLPVRLSPTMIREMAQQAGMADQLDGPGCQSEKFLGEAISAEKRAIQNAKWLLAIAMRREKTRLSNLFADPGWFILLDLFVQESLGKQTSINSACVASMSPPSTGLRWITLLVDRGFIRRKNDPTDNRRVFLTLTKETSKELTDLLSKLG